MTLPQVPPITSGRLEQLETNLEPAFQQHHGGNAVFAQPERRYPDDDVRGHWLMAKEVVSMIQELKRRRKKMGYREGTS